MSRRRAVFSSTRAIVIHTLAAHAFAAVAIALGLAALASCARTDVRYGEPTRPRLESASEAADAAHDTSARGEQHDVGPEVGAPRDAAVADASFADASVADATPPDAERDAPIDVDPFESRCTDGRDDDGDGAIDCADTDCATDIACLSGDPIVSLALNRNHHCLHRRSGRVVCWGSNVGMQLGAIGDTDAPREMSFGLSPADEVATFGGGTCVRQGAQVRCIGPMLGAEPRTIDAFEGAVELAGGACGEALCHFCVRKNDGSVWCIGDNEFGQLGRGFASNEILVEPAPVLDLDDAVRLTLGSEHTCAVRADESAVCWGRNVTGRLGSGVSADEERPVRVDAASPLSDIDGSAGHTCATTRGRVPLCWGRNRDGQVGWDRIEDAFSPARVRGVRDVTDVATTQDASFALHEDGTVWRWGPDVEPYEPWPAMRVIDGGWTLAGGVDLNGNPWFGELPLCVEDSGFERCNCDNGLDDDGDGTIDCADADCADTDVCLGLECVPDGQRSEGSFLLEERPERGIATASPDDTCFGDVDASRYFFTPTDPGTVAVTLATGSSSFPNATVAGIQTRCESESFVCGTPERRWGESGSFGPARPLLWRGEVDGAGIVISVVPAEANITLEAQRDVTPFGPGCTDGTDNDGDGLVDCDDPDCDCP